MYSTVDVQRGLMQGQSVYLTEVDTGQFCGDGLFCYIMLNNSQILNKTLYLFCME